MNLIDCPECGLPAEVVGKFTLASTSGPIELVKLRCIAGHVLTPLVERLARATPPGLTERPLHGDAGDARIRFGPGAAAPRRNTEFPRD